MLILASTSDLVQVVTDATADIEVHASWVDLVDAATTATPNRTNTASITTATTTTVVASPAASTKRNVKHLNITNNHASTSCTVSVVHTDGTNAEELISVILLAGENLTLDAIGQWTHYDVNGGQYPAIGNAATQGQMEAAAQTDVYVSPGRQQYHPSAAKFWVIFTGNSTTILASYNMTSITDGTTEATVTIATDFSSANWCCLATATGTATTAAASRHTTARAIAAGTIIVFCTDAGATPALADPTQWMVAGFGDQA